jgi:NAD(P)-dependent dehydrogenase (short-subunit alcohol dehydrogenase family)
MIVNGNPGKSPGADVNPVAGLVRMTIMSEQKTWFITGCDKGMGYVFAETFLEQGDRVVVTARDIANIQPLLQRYPGTALGYQLDVTSGQAIAEVVAAAEQATGGIDVLVNNAGYGMLGPVEATTPEEYRPLFDVNFFGAAEVTRAVLPGMRRRRRGYIVNTTSIGGFAASPGFGFYAASKFALEGLSEALAQDVAALGIKVTILEPGSTRTDFAGGSMAKVKASIADYDGTAVKLTLERMAARHGAQPGDPARIARILLRFSRMANPPLRFATGEDGLGRMREKLKATSAAAEQFAALSLAVGFDCPTPIAIDGDDTP